MVLDRRITRRQLLKSGAGAAAAATMASLLPTVALGAPPAGQGGRLIPAGKVGTITFTQRDVPGRIGIAASQALGLEPTMGFLGGPGYPEDPTDLGPLVPLPGGWRELFEFFSGLGIKQVEFAGYNQNSNNPGGSAPSVAPGGVTTPESRAAYVAYGQTLRGFLDEFGLEAIGNHGFIPNTWPGPNSAGGAMSTQDFNRYQAELEFAATLGMPFMGTGNDPASANNPNIEPWTIAGEKWEALNTLSLEWGIHLYPHNHSPAYRFLQDGPMVEVTVDRLTGDPLPAPQIVRGESGKRLMQHYLDITDPDLCLVELDIYWAHVAQHQHRWYYDWDGNRVENIFDPVAQVAAQPIRYALYHAKDGDRTTQDPGVGNGYNIVPFGDPSSDIDFVNFYQNQGARGYHNSNYEQDNAPGGSSDRGQSLRFTKSSIANMINLRG